MHTYVIGDVHGCYTELMALLERVAFDPSNDKLLFVGDLVNRGPQSLQTLRFVRGLGSSAVTVLGNHDLHLLAVYYGIRPLDKNPTLLPVINAPDADDLIHWLQQQPLLVQHNRYIQVHAGIHPLWDLPLAQQLASELGETIAAIRDADALLSVYGSTTGDWAALQNSPQRLRYALNCFTRMRFCTREAELDFTENGPPGSQPDTLLPWFELPNPALTDHTVLFGHWAALGEHLSEHAICLDTGCAWGNHLSAMRLSDQQIYSVPSSIRSST